GIRVTTVQFEILCKCVLKDKPPRRGHNASDKMIGTLDVERPAIALKLGRKQHGVRLVDLLRGIATSSTSPPTLAWALASSSRADCRVVRHSCNEADGIVTRTLKVKPLSAFR